MALPQLVFINIHEDTLKNEQKRNDSNSENKFRNFNWNSWICSYGIRSCFKSSLAYKRRNSCSYFCILDDIMAINYMLIKILIGAVMFGTIAFISKKYKWILALILTAYLVMLGAGVI